jgi:hypothetical protein
VFLDRPRGVAADEVLAMRALDLRRTLERRVIDAIGRRISVYDDNVGTMVW